jgi:putative addiction module component (TIGR02574 family)
MSPTIERLREELLALPTEERESLIASISQNADKAPFTLHPAWPAELRFRSEEYRAGRMEGIPWEQYEKELDEPVDLP